MRDLHIYCAEYPNTRPLKFKQAEDGTIVLQVNDNETLLSVRKVDRLIAWLSEARSNMVDRDHDPEVA